MSKKMFRYEIPVDGREHEVELQGDVLHVEAGRTKGLRRHPHTVEFWAEGNLEGEGTKRTFLAFGTDHPVPEGAVWRGTTPRATDGTVWHLYEQTGS